ncbi:MAG TPA: PucR family transcriptional regulator ligand-binding domain-containing protein [Solirubrobacterales bacterium]|nr:PucR family transcriptional regulator ligand-binding domain-containing protein [Solirubrobacterales bacterium]
MSSRALTVSDFIELPVIQAALPQLVAGGDGLGAEVRWVHSLDVPDVSNLLRGGEMILTTGVSIGSDAKAQRRFVRDLVAEGAVGVVVELGFAWHRELPVPLVEEAERLNFPLVSLRRGVRFVEVSEAVNGSLLNSGHALARRGEELHRNLDALVLEGAGAEVVLAEVARLIGNPVVLEDARGELVAYSSTTQTEAAVVDSWSGLKWAGEGTGDADGALAQPVTVRSRTWGRVVAIQTDSEFDRFTPIAMERAAVAVGLGLMRGGEEEELRARSKGNLLFELAAGLIDPLAAARRASTLGFPRRHGQLVAVAAVWRGGALAEGMSYEEAWAPLLAPMRGALSEPDRPALIGSRGNCVLGVLDRGSKGSEPDDAASRERLATRFKGALALHEVDPDQVSFAISGMSESWDQVSEALVRARLAAEAGAVGPVRPWHDASRTEVGQLLLSMRGTPELLAFSDERLGPLLEVGGDRGRDLFETLEVYLHSGGRKTEAAQILEIERQSLYHRLVRIESILDVDLKDGDTALSLHLAVMIRRLLAR